MDDSVDASRRLYLRTMQNRKCMLTSSWRLCQQRHVNTRFGYRYTTKGSGDVAKPWILSSGDGRLNRGRTPYL